MTFLTNGYSNELFYYTDSFSKLMECYKYGIPYRSDTILYDIPNENIRYNITLNSCDIYAKQIDIHSFHPMHIILPETIIHAYDTKDLKYIPRKLPKELKPKYLYHGTPIINFISILLNRNIYKSSRIGGGKYVYCHDKSMKTRCLYYGGENCVLLEIDTSKYEVDYLLLLFEYGIPVDVSIFDVNSIEFYLKKELICVWQKETIMEKVKTYNQKLRNIVPVDHLDINLNDEEIYDIYNKLII